ncbi:hypothetical protein SteCoe_4126 [Stentor coeruleus]|uniref:Uncharacterized protein n=1 Tax=Stentor coeruleus TaxID=5963 RepID=A0A1R2CVP7_9CILI|nr:hypothetical protein SteCoe_4126 [Stentor coeruleus]
MGQNSSCSCVSDESRLNLESFVELPNITKEDVDQIWKCFEYLNPKSGIVRQESLIKCKDNSPAYMNEIIESLLSTNADITFDDFFRLMKPKVIMLKSQNKDSVLMESNSTNVSCLICPYKSSQSALVKSNE